MFTSWFKDKLMLSMMKLALPGKEALTWNMQKLWLALATSVAAGMLVAFSVLALEGGLFYYLLLQSWHWFPALALLLAFNLSITAGVMFYARHLMQKDIVQIEPKSPAGQAETIYRAGKSIISGFLLGLLEAPETVERKASHLALHYDITQRYHADEKSLEAPSPRKITAFFNRQEIIPPVSNDP